MFSKVAFSQHAFFMYSSNTHYCHGRAPSLTCRMDMKSTSSISLIGEKEEALTKQPQSHQSDRDINQESRYFGEFVAREALLDEEYWTAAWLRAESHWENRPNERYANNYKRQFAEQEYNALKRKCKGYHGQQSMCIITIKKEDKKIKHTILKSVVATLDLSIRHLLQGETFPGERIQAPMFCNIKRKEASKYGYVANLCVAKSARRKGIAINMLKFAIESAKSKGNLSIQSFYKKTAS
ncbi:Signal recognition particle receptor FtsY [Bienertia sinuspersici]